MIISVRVPKLKIEPQGKEWGSFREGGNWNETRYLEDPLGRHPGLVCGHVDPGLTAGRFDSLNSCTANAEMSRRLEATLQRAYTFTCFEGGHMMCRDEQALAADVRSAER